MQIYIFLFLYRLDVEHRKILRFCKFVDFKPRLCVNSNIVFKPVCFCFSFLFFFCLFRERLSFINRRGRVARRRRSKWFGFDFGFGQKRKLKLILTKCVRNYAAKLRVGRSVSSKLFEGSNYPNDRTMPKIGEVENTKSESRGRQQYNWSFDLAWKWGFFSVDFQSLNFLNRQTKLSRNHCYYKSYSRVNKKPRFNGKSVNTILSVELHNWWGDRSVK